VRGTLLLAKGKANLRPLLRVAPHASRFKAVQWLVLALITRLQIHAPTPKPACPLAPKKILVSGEVRRPGWSKSTRPLVAVSAPKSWSRPAQPSPAPKSFPLTTFLALARPLLPISLPLYDGQARPTPNGSNSSATAALLRTTTYPEKPAASSPSIDTAEAEHGAT